LQEVIKIMKRNYIIQLRKQAKMKSKDVAEKLGITASYYNLIENCKRNPSVKLVLKMENLFDVPLMRYFFGSKYNISSINSVNENALYNTNQKLQVCQVKSNSNI